VDQVTALKKPLLVGESNPYGSDPEFALWPMPRASAGGRLCEKIMRLPRHEYIERFDRANLCAGPWRVREARARASEILREDRGVLVLFGANVARAFDLEFAPFTTWGGEPLVVLLPHPSARCRIWNRHGSIERARATLVESGVL
jgi:hypothetical protein